MDIQSSDVAAQLSRLERGFDVRQDQSQTDRDRIETKIERVAALAQDNNSAIMLMEQTITQTSKSVETLANNMSNLVTAMQRNEVVSATRTSKFEDIVNVIEGSPRNGNIGLVEMVNQIVVSRAKDRAFLLGVISVSTAITPILTVLLAKWIEQIFHLN